MTEVDNPFRPGGDLDQEADAILRNSTIQRDSLQICDPRTSGCEGMSQSGSVVAGDVTDAAIPLEAVEVVITSDKASRVHFSPRHGDSAGTEQQRLSSSSSHSPPSSKTDAAKPVAPTVQLNGGGDETMAMQSAAVVQASSSSSKPVVLKVAVGASEQPMLAETVNLSASADGKKRNLCCAVL